MEEKLKIEGEIVSLKRELKNTRESLEHAKSDISDIISIKERVTNEISERKDELTKVLNDISDAELKWALKKQGEIDELDKQRKECREILARKAELDEQEKRIQKIHDDTVVVRNDNRALELKIERDMTVLKAKEREIEDSKKAIEDYQAQKEEEIEKFKSGVLLLAETVKTL